MALLRFEGFDMQPPGGYNDRNQAIGGKQLSMRESGVSSVPVIGRYNLQQALRGSGGFDGLAVSVPPRKSFTTGFLLYVDSFAGALDRSFFWLGGQFEGPESTDRHMTIGIRTNGTLFVTSGNGNLLGDSTVGIISTGTWYRVELEATIDNAVGAFDLHVDGVSEVSGSGVDTQGGSTDDNVAVVVVGTPPGSIDIRTDAFYFLDSVATPGHPVTFLGDWAVETSLPIADGFQTDFTPVGAGSDNADRVGEGPDADFDTTYNESATVGAIDSFTMEPLVLGGDILAVQLSAMNKKDRPSQRYIRTRIRSNATDAFGANNSVVSDYEYTRPQIEVFDPDTGTAWTRATVDAAEYGYEIMV